MEKPQVCPQVAAIATGNDIDSFSFLGMHRVADTIFVRTFQPQAARVAVLRASDGECMGELPRIHPAGIFAGPVAGDSAYAYRLRLDVGGRQVIAADPYSFGPVLREFDTYLHAEGSYSRSFEKMGAHPIVMDGVEGTGFAVWAPNARRVSVVGDFNEWDGRCHTMRRHLGAGLWDIFLPGVAAGAIYKYEIKTGEGAILLKADPYAFQTERPPRQASVVRGLVPRPSIESRPSADRRDPVCIYEVHLGSWRRLPEEGGRVLTYGELADTLIPYVKGMGFTHIELMPISEHPFDGSWGYQPTGLYAPTSRHGSPDDFCRFVARCHAEGLGLLLDWVAGHFPSDGHGLVRFDGTHLYEHQDPREGLHPDWDTLIYNFGRKEVCNYLLSNALFWLSQYGVDGLRVDAVASMLYRNYSRKEGEWIPNINGGVENLEAVDFLQRMNELVYRECPDTVTIAEESTAWPMVSRPTYIGGLGFGYKWNMGWMHDTLEYMAKDPIHRKFHHDKLTFGLLYGFSENFILPLSHDEVVHGKGSLLGKMPGDRLQKFANLRAYLAFMYTQPGKKLLFMGGEFGQESEWNHDRSLDWHEAEETMHAGIQRLVRDLNGLYRSMPALHSRDCEPEGFSWIDSSDGDSCVISYVRCSGQAGDFAVVICNFTPVVRHHYRLGVPRKGCYREVLNTDSTHYGGSNLGNTGAVATEDVAAHGQDFSLSLVLPPLAVIVLLPERIFL
jgi:1,4-alpha-glucan branching enzyme